MEILAGSIVVEVGRAVVLEVVAALALLGLLPDQIVVNPADVLATGVSLLMPHPCKPLRFRALAGRAEVEWIVSLVKGQKIPDLELVAFCQGLDVRVSRLERHDFPASHFRQGTRLRRTTPYSSSSTV